MSLLSALPALMRKEDLLGLIELEKRQALQEGADLRHWLKGVDQSAGAERLAAAYQCLLSAPRNPDFPYREPTTLDTIRAARPDGPRQTVVKTRPDRLYDRIHGAWLGRVAGCVLGKPVEPWGQKVAIREYLQQAGAYPLQEYFPRLDPLPDGFQFGASAAGTFRGEIHGAPPDDDTDYTVLGLHLLERFGLELTPAQVASAWLDRLAYARTWTAERATYRNLILGIPAEQAALVVNPEREYIGARIRADIFGLACPGQPERAAGLAYQDATLSHSKNGVYAAMFLAACLAWAFTTDEIDSILRAGLAEIPAGCRLARSIQEVIGLHEKQPDWEAAYETLLPEMASLHPVHAINNTVWMVLALLYGAGDFDRTLGIAVMCGFDTDCNGANAGALLGLLYGAQALPAKWTAPLQDTLHTSLADWHETRISALARRTADLAEKFLTGENHVR